MTGDQTSLWMESINICHIDGFRITTSCVGFLTAENKVVF